MEISACTFEVVLPRAWHGTSASSHFINRNSASSPGWCVWQLHHCVHSSYTAPQGVLFHQTWPSEASEIQQVPLWDASPHWGSYLEPFLSFYSNSDLNDVLRIDSGWDEGGRFGQVTTRVAFSGWTCSILKSGFPWRAGSPWKEFFPLGNPDLSSLDGVTIG